MKDLPKFAPDDSMFETQAPKTKKGQEDENNLRKKLTRIVKSEGREIDNS